MSLSKVGLPSVRTGILVAPEPLAKAVASANSILNLTNSGFGPALIQPLLETNALVEMSAQIIRPYYERRKTFALQTVSRIFGDRFPYRIHRAQGSIFLWIWFPDLAIRTRELYRRLKEKGVLVVPGDAFFFGLPPNDDNWAHRRQCVRVNYSRGEREVELGLKILADVVEQAIP
jgi:valine--pyruvate aminotransferase